MVGCCSPAVDDDWPFGWIFIFSLFVFPVAETSEDRGAKKVDYVLGIGVVVSMHSIG